ncbi:uncharacterized protein TrAFT101_004104 [Trichoderma asperellum]|uniref:uncharacterized protein n=1 Tax=Trichoderma asperellum TaxID=101201 RepID=UPI00331B481E|nr:hypothetical protein TrAFT101_004104 [Trichoderma asperellum]
MCIALRDCDSSDASHPATPIPAANPAASHVTQRSSIDETTVFWTGSGLTRARNSGVLVQRYEKQLGSEVSNGLIGGSQVGVPYMKLQVVSARRRPLGSC